MFIRVKCFLFHRKEPPFDVQINEYLTAMKIHGHKHILFIRTIALIAAVVFCVCAAYVETFAEITGEDAFYDSIWNYLFEDNMVNNGVIQSICATPEYLITIENTSDDPSVPDTVSAYYKNPFDRDGNPVEQYSLVRRNTDFDWEHGNGMTYNPDTNEIYVALYSNDAGDNEGSLYVMDPETLAFKRKIKIAEGYNILGIDYDSENNVYYTLTNADASFSLQKRDTDFNLLEDYGPVDPAPGTNFQDICVSGDYIFLSPLTYGMGIGDFMNIYSISRRETILSIDMDMGIEAPFIEAEGVCMAHKGVFVCPVTVTRENGNRHVYFFETTLPWYFTIEACARGLSYEGEHTFFSVDKGDGDVRYLNMDGTDHISSGTDEKIGGTMSPGSTKVLRGSSYTVTFEPDPGYKVAGIYLDRTKLDVDLKNTTSYTLDNIDGNHRITVDFIPTARSSSPTVAPTEKAEDETASVSDTADEAEDSLSGADMTDSPGAARSESETSVTSSGAAGSQSNSAVSGQKVRRRAFVFTILILLILIFILALVILYGFRVRRIREQKAMALKKERRLEKLREERREKMRREERMRRKSSAARSGEHRKRRAGTPAHSYGRGQDQQQGASYQQPGARYQQQSTPYNAAPYQQPGTQYPQQG